MEIERVSFPEAIRLVAEKTGVPVPKLDDDSRFEWCGARKLMMLSSSTNGHLNGGGRSSSQQGRAEGREPHASI